MKKQFNITSEDRKHILGLHSILSEQAQKGMIAGSVKNEDNKPVELPKVNLFNSENKIVRNITGNLDGDFNLGNIDVGKYKISVNADSYKLYESDIEVKPGNNKLDIKLQEAITEVESVSISQSPLTILDFFIKDENGNPIDSGDIEIKSGLFNNLYDGKFENGGIRLIYDTKDKLVTPNQVITQNKNDKDGFFSSDEKGYCKENKKIKVKIKKEGYENIVDTFNPCVKNASFSSSIKTNDDGSITITPIEGDNGIPKKINSQSNIFNITLKKIPPAPEPTPEPEPEVKDPKLRACKKLTIDLYNKMKDVYNGVTTINDIGPENIIKQRKQVQNCYVEYKQKYGRQSKKAIANLSNTPTTKKDIKKYFELQFTADQQHKIYSEMFDLRLNKIIKEEIFKKLSTKKDKR